ncbi:hypothetical protein [Poritiphilus flavus]|uniref:Uncharacterized protein n=1 Tax=Poritiphilus flavus TaxID=2697053 RepID=A0A6L9E8I4_9FLAO|nr:hypothetical protein [Poritiphilus flavus]NAS10769.1 hypothetical protein [Poritiphilus flavus]
MPKKRRQWLWNILIVLTIVICGLAFIVHYKNWVKVEKDHLRILSGIYYKEVQYVAIDSVKMVERIPQMERINGFSAWEKEKGVFKDSLNPENTVHVYVDNLLHPKIKVVHSDSLKLYINFSDSLETVETYQILTAKMDSVKAQLSAQK